MTEVWKRFKVLVFGDPFCEECGYAHSEETEHLKAYIEASLHINDDKRVPGWVSGTK